MPCLEVPYLRSPVYRHGPLAAFGSRTKEALSSIQAEVLDHLVKADALLGDLARVVADSKGGSIEEAAGKLRAAYEDPNNIVGLAKLDLAEQYDIIAIDQGYGGVYVHTVEMVEKLRRRWRVLLISPEDPLFEDSRHPDDVTVPRLREADPSLGYFSFVQIVRALISRLKPRLLFVSHRTQSLFLYDLIDKQPTIIHCDGYFDGSFKMQEQFSGGIGVHEDPRLLEEVHYVLGQSSPGAYAIFGGPNVSLPMLKTGYLALARARENWCWGWGQTTSFQTWFPDLRDRIRFEPPFTDPELFDRSKVDRERVILFTTTMHNIDRKGLPELVKAMELLPEARVRCIVRQPHLLPPIPASVRVRMTMGSVKKPEMIDIYHRVWLNCRTSREESSPMSILEAMTCEVPQIVSPTVAEQIPLLEDGKTGFVVDPDDIPRIARCMRQLLEDPGLRDRQGAECRNRALEYSLDRRMKVFERYLP